MDNRFSNIVMKRKKGKYAQVQGTGMSRYDIGLYYLSIMIQELLTAYYYTQQNESRLLPEEVYEEMNWQNEEPRFMGKVLDIFIEVTLSKIIECNKNTWNFHQLLKEARNYNRSDYEKIEKEISDFEKKIKFIKDNRNERYAHTSKKNQPYELHTKVVGGYKEIIIKSMDILDMFVDGIIPYKMEISESKEIDLRANINQLET